MAEIAKLFADYGVTGLIIIAFFWQYIDQRKTNKEREEKLYKVIDTLAEKIPSIEQSLTRIERSIAHGREHKDC